MIGFIPGGIDNAGREGAVGSEGTVARDDRVGRALPTDNNIKIGQRAAQNRPPAKLTGISLPLTITFLYYIRRLDLPFVMAEFLVLQNNVRISPDLNYAY